MQGCKPFALVNKGAHAGAIVGMDAQRAGSLILTAGGQDHTLRCIDAARGVCVAALGLAEAVHAVALHPAVPQAAVAKRSAIKLYDILWCVAAPHTPSTYAQSLP